MTKEEMQQKSQEKSQAIQTLCKQLQVTISAEQMINEQGLIKLIVFYSDNEKYPIDKPEEKLVPLATDKPLTKNKDETIPKDTTLQ